jgi:hypothetical protein
MGATKGTRSLPFGAATARVFWFRFLMNAALRNGTGIADYQSPIAKPETGL